MSLTQNEKYEINICSNIMGDSLEERLSPSQTSFRRDLKLLLEAAGVQGVKLLISDDSRF